MLLMHPCKGIQCLQCHQCISWKKMFLKRPELKLRHCGIETWSHFAQEGHIRGL